MPGQYLPAPPGAVPPPAGGPPPDLAAPPGWTAVPPSYAPQDAGLAPGPYGPGPQYAALPPVDGSARPKKKRTWLWVTLVVVALLLVGAGIGGYFLLRDDGKAAISEAAQQYYQAIADGDAAAALDRLASEPSSTALLTDDVLAASTKAAPISDIATVVESSTADEAQVTVEYQMGGQGVEQTLTVQKIDGDWKVGQGTATVDLTAAGTGSLPLQLNGSPVDEPSQAVLFPGSYTLTTTAPYVVLGDNTFEVTDIDVVEAAAVTATLTDDGVAAFQAAVRGSVDACVAATTIAMDCAWLPMASTLDNGTELVDGTIQRTLTPAAQTWLDELSPTLDTDDPALASVPQPDTATVGVTVFAHGIYGGQEVSGPISSGTPDAPVEMVFPFGRPTIDMSDPDNLAVVWD